MKNRGRSSVFVTRTKQAHRQGWGKVHNYIVQTNGRTRVSIMPAGVEGEAGAVNAELHNKGVAELGDEVVDSRGWWQWNVVSPTRQ